MKSNQPPAQPRKTNPTCTPKDMYERVIRIATILAKAQTQPKKHKNSILG
jgi:hypothetical protein